MSKYRITKVTFTVTNPPIMANQFQVTVTGVNVEDDKDVATFSDEQEASVIQLLASMYLDYGWEDDLCYFDGEHVEVELPNKEKAIVFCCYSIDENGNKIYARGHHPTWKMHELWIQMQQEASQTQPTTTGGIGDILDSAVVIR